MKTGRIGCLAAIVATGGDARMRASPHGTDRALDRVTATSQSDDSKASPAIIALTGFMGSGKTTTGRALAELLGWEFVDLDEVIEREAGVSIRELFRERGEEGFRTMEHLALRKMLTE